MTTLFIPLPNSLRRKINGACRCNFCKAHPDREPQWDTLGYDTEDGASWVVHNPEVSAYPARPKPPLRDYEITFADANDDWTWIYEQARDYHDAMAVALDMCPVGARVHSIVFMTPEQATANQKAMAQRERRLTA